MPAAETSLNQGLVSTARKAARRFRLRSATALVKALSAVPARGKIPSGEVFLARKASEHSRGFIPYTQTLVTGQERPRSRRLPVIILENAPHGEAAVADLADQHGFATPNFLERVAARIAEEDPHTALRLRRRAAEIQPHAAHRHLSVARTLNEIPVTGTVHDWILGLADGETTVTSSEALQALRRAHEIDPSNPYILHEYGAALVETGHVDQALPLLEMAVLKSPHEDWFTELADIYRRPDIAKFEKAMTYYERVFEMDSKNTKALAGLINAGTRGPMDWARIWRSVRKLELGRVQVVSPYEDADVAAQLDRLFWSEHDPQPEQVDALVTSLRHQLNQDNKLHPLSLGLVITRLQFARYFTAGFQLRADLAQERTRTLRRSPITDPPQLRSLMKAHIYLDDAAAATELAEPQFWRLEDDFETRQIQKLHADAQLMAGDIQPFLEYSAQVRRRTPLNADKTMENLLQGQRVALVGPADTGDRLGQVIDEYDVVVRPRYQPEFIAENSETQGSRTDITYYSGQDLTTLFDSIAGAAEAGDIKVVNARPFSHAAHAHRNLSWLRFYRQDFSLCFHGGSLGIQRIAYDLLQFEPQEICVFNADLYTGNSMFTTGWREGDTFGPYSHINDIVVSHDVGSEFRFMKALMNTGVVTAQGRAAEVLEQSPQEYVRAVEEAGVLR